MGVLDELRAESKRKKKREKEILKLYEMPIAQSNIIQDNVVYVSIFPEARFSKPVGEDKDITLGLRRFNTMFGVPEFINQVARKGKTFCGCVFLDLEYYKKAYGKCEDLQRFDESCLIWEILYEQAIGTPYSEFQNIETNFRWHHEIENAKNNVRNTKDYFILMSTFGLDVDKKQDKKGNDITPPYGEMYKEVKARIEDLDLNVLFAYKTFSDPEKGERFRLIFKTNVPIFSWDIAQAMLILLQAMFPEYFDNNCTNVNRQFHGSNTLIEEKHPLFGKSIEIDKYFRSFEQFLKQKDSSNFSKNMKSYSQKTGINLLNGIFHVRKVTLSKTQLEQLRTEQLETYNKDIYPEYHFCISGNTCKKFFGSDEAYENVESLYYYIITNRRIRKQRRTRVL